MRIATEHRVWVGHQGWEADRPHFKPHLPNFPAVCLWSGDSMALSLSFIISKMGTSRPSL